MHELVSIMFFFFLPYHDVDMQNGEVDLRVHWVKNSDIKVYMISNLSPEKPLAAMSSLALSSWLAVYIEGSHQKEAKGGVL